MSNDKVFKSLITKVDENLGLVFGWGIICKADGKDYIDLQDQHIPQEVMLKSVSDFMTDSRIMKTMHAGSKTGDIVHSFPLTEEIAKAMGIQSDTFGWMVAAKPHDPQILKDFASGKLTGFSVGGNADLVDM